MQNYVRTQEALATVCEQLRKETAVGVDTEFFWEDTYYPILGLVQVAAADGNCWLIDPVEIKDIRAFGAVLADPGVIKILHDAQQDLAILARATGALPKNVFDTRLAAGFAGLDSTCSLKKLLEVLLDLHLAKTETRSNWIRRPLSPEQLEYAADDVIYLPKARELLISRCLNDEVRGWMAEEQAFYEDPNLYHEREPEDMFTRVKGAFSLKGRALAVLQELAAWREREARQRDWPRAHIVEDESLLIAATEQPQDVASFIDIRCVSRRMPPEVVTEALAAIQRGRSKPENEWPHLLTHTAEDRRKMKPAADALLQKIAANAAKYQIDPMLIASRHDVEAWLQSPEEKRAEFALAKGWRTKVLNQTAAC